MRFPTKNRNLTTTFYASEIWCNDDDDLRVFIMDCTKRKYHLHLPGCSRLLYQTAELPTEFASCIICLVEKCQWPPRSMPFLPASATSTRIALFKCNFNLHVYCCREVFTSFHVVIVALIIIMTIHSSTPPPSLPLPSDSLLDANGERGSNDDDDEWTSGN